MMFEIAKAGQSTKKNQTWHFIMTDNLCTQNNFSRFEMLLIRRASLL